jgi:YegS/Rv2252/BmrU family lipid kinase
MDNVWKVIINPYAGGNMNALTWDRISNELKEAGIHFVHQVSEYHGHIISIVNKDIVKGNRRFIIVGGDGSLNEMVNGIYKQSIVPPDEIITAHISLGTGNDWQRTHGLPSGSLNIIERIKTGHTKMQDIGVVRYFKAGEAKVNYFVNVAGMGFDAFVVMNTQKKIENISRRKFAYLRSLLFSLLSYKCKRVQITIDGKEVFGESLFSFNAGIGKYNGGGMMQVPDAIPDDGMLDITIFRKMHKLKVIANVKRLYDGSFKSLPEVSQFRCKTVEFDSEYPVMLECDGELLGHSPAQFTIIPQGFRFIC